MNRVDRLMAMVLQLQGRRLVRAEDLADHFEISLRTVYRDLAALGEAGIPIVAEAGVGYSLMRGYHLPPVMFTAEEASALSLSAMLVENLTDASLRKQMQSALLKIRSILPRERQDYLDRLERSTAVLACRAEPTPRRPSETLIPIQRALAERRVLALDYEGGKRRGVTHRKVEPLGLVYYADNWHLIAFCRLRGDVRDFRTDRIGKLAMESEVFTGHTDFSLKTYLESAMGQGDFEMAQVRFVPEVIERVRRDWSCGLVEETPDQNGFVATLLTPSLEGLAAWLLSFGSKAEVLAPRRLQELLMAEAAEVLGKYPAGHRSDARVDFRKSLLT